MKKHNQTPPKSIIKFLRWFCQPELVRYIEGDLIELYKERLEQMNSKRAKFRFLMDVLLLIRWSLIRKPSIFSFFTSSKTLYKNYLVVAWRGLLKNRVYGILNITGLSLGICIFIISYLFVNDELSYDQFHSKKDRIFRFTNSEQINDDVRHRVGTTYPLAEVVKDEFPMIEKVARFYHHPDYLGLPLIQVNQSSFLLDQLTWTDPEVFDIFSFEFLEGNPKTCLQDLRSLVITKSMALQLFGEEPALGQEIIMQFDRDNDPDDLFEPYSMTITGVIQNPPSNSHLSFDVLANIRFSNAEKWSKKNWYFQAFPTYVLLNDPQALENITSLLPGFIQKYYDPKIKDRLTVHLQALSDIRLESLPGSSEYSSNKETIWVIIVITIMVLALACVNFVNLSTARYTRRAKEVGLRKVIGAQKNQIILQFLCESILISYLATIFSVILTYLALPFFNSLMDKNLQLELLEWPLSGLIALIGLIVGVMSGLYPSAFLASFRPSNALKGSVSGGQGNILIRKGLVIFQFVVTMTLLIAIGTIYDQMAFLENIDLDIDRKQYVFLRSKEQIYSHQETTERFKQTLIENNQIKSASSTWSIPFGVNAPVFFYPFLPQGYNSDERVHMHLFRADHDFLKTFEIGLIAGRDFSRKFPTDPTSAYILNTSALKALGWSADEAIGKDLEVFSGGGTSFKKGKVIGVVKDFNFLSLHKKVSPMVISMANDKRYRYIAINIEPTKLAETIGYIEDIWKEFTPGWPVELFFMEDEWRKNYQNEERLADTVKYLTLIAIFIACLGLFGLASYSAEQKEKEIGIRKVLGASVSGILALISKEFIWLITIAFIIATPLGWYYSHEWLGQFAYRIELGWQLYTIVIALSLVITFLTVAYHSIKASVANPVDVLRNE